MRFSSVTKGTLAAIGCVTMLATAGAFAQDRCDEAALLSLSEMVITRRMDLPPLQARRFGTQAVYLQIQYGSSSDSQIEGLLAQAVDSGAHNAPELNFAWRISRYGLEATLAFLGPEALNEAVASAQVSSIRALLLNGNWDETMAAIAAQPVTDQVRIFPRVIASVIDQPDPLKAEMGEAAAEHGLPWLAAGFAAAQSDPEAWARHVEGLDAEALDQVASFWHWLPPMLGNPLLVRRPADLEAEAQSNRDLMARAGYAGALQPDREFLNTWFNYTGDAQNAAAAADTVIAQFEDGSLQPGAPLDAGWLVAYRALLQAGVAPEDIHSMLNGSSYSLGRYGRGTGADAMDWILAVDALTPYLRNETQQPPKSPKTFSDGFTDWDHWVVLATHVKADPSDPAFATDQEDLPILAELLFASGETEALTNMLAEAPLSLASISMANDLSARLDRLCDGHLAHKAEAVMLAGQPIYKFFSPLD